MTPSAKYASCGPSNDEVGLVELPSHSAWLDARARDLRAFGARTAGEHGGARWLAGDGAPDLDQPIRTSITAGMTHVYWLGSLMSVPGVHPPSTLLGSPDSASPVTTMPLFCLPRRPQ